MKVWICELSHGGGWHTWEWLCKACVLLRRAARDERGHPVWSKVAQMVQWTPWAPGKEQARAVDGRCCDCERARQAAPGYVTPTVDAVQVGATYTSARPDVERRAA